MLGCPAWVQSPWFPLPPLVPLIAPEAATSASACLMERKLSCREEVGRT